MFGGTIFVNEEGNRPLTDAMLAEAVHCGHLVSFAKQAIGIDSLVREYDLIAGGTVRCIDSYFLQAIEITPPPISAVGGEELVEREEYEKFIFSAEWTGVDLTRIRTHYAPVGSGKWEQSLLSTIMDVNAPYFVNWWDSTGESIISVRASSYLSGAFRFFPFYSISSGADAIWTDSENINSTVDFIQEDSYGLTGVCLLNGTLVGTELNGGIWYFDGGDWVIVEGTEGLFSYDVDPFYYAGAGRFSPDGKNGFVQEFILFGDQIKVTFELDKDEDGKIVLVDSEKTTNSVDVYALAATINESASCSHSWEYGGEPDQPPCAYAEVDYPYENCPFGFSCDPYTWRHTIYPGGVPTTVTTLKATNAFWYEPTGGGATHGGNDCGIFHEEARWSDSGGLTDSTSQAASKTTNITLPAPVEIEVAADYKSDGALVKVLYVANDYEETTASTITTTAERVYGRQGGEPIDTSGLNLGLVFGEDRDWLSQDTVSDFDSNYSMSTTSKLTIEEDGSEVFSKEILSVSISKSTVVDRHTHTDYAYLSSTTTDNETYVCGHSETITRFLPIAVDPRSKTVVGISSTLTISASYSGSYSYGGSLDPPLSSATTTYSWSDFVVEVYSGDGQHASMTLEGSAGSKVEDGNHFLAYTYNVANHISVNCSTSESGSDTYSFSYDAATSLAHSLMQDYGYRSATFTQNGDVLLYYFNEQPFLYYPAISNAFQDDDKIIIGLQMLYDAKANKIIPLTTFDSQIEDENGNSLDVLFGVYRQSELDELNYVKYFRALRTHHNT